MIAVGPTLLALRAGRRQMLAAAAVCAGALLAPIALLSASFVSATGGSVSTAGTIFQPWQAFWFLGRHGALVHGLFGNAKPGYRTAPAWVGPISHPLVVLCGLLLPAALWWHRRRNAGGRTVILPLADALLLLCLLSLLRCLLDTWDNVYYVLPFLISLVAFEVSACNRPPVIALGATVLCWASFQWLPEVASADAQAAFFLAWTAPLAAVLAGRLFAGSLRLSVPRPAARRGPSAPLAGG